MMTADIYTGVDMSLLCLVYPKTHKESGSSLLDKPETCKEISIQVEKALLFLDPPSIS